jgi:CRISPR-associated endonuclease/helicase Cas3
MTSQSDPLSADGLGVLWGKSNAGGRPNLLVQHLLDTAAVAELLWDGYLAPAFRRRVDACCAGQGRPFFTLLCGIHDVGKASPAFQVKDRTLSAAVQRSGLTWSAFAAEGRRWHHTVAGAVIVREVLAASGWQPEAVDWVWPLVAGHHGRVPAHRSLTAVKRRDTRRAHGEGPAWAAVQGDLLRFVAHALDVDLVAVAPAGRPSRGVQLALSGTIIMADWIASGDHFPGVDRWDAVSVSLARDRARNAIERLELRGGWAPAPYVQGADLVRLRFDRPARPSQLEAIALAEAMPAAGLLMIEAPMGEGKTEAALAAAEVLARRFGADGIFVGMPTQATSDPMYSRVRQWADSVEKGLPVGLLHGKRAFNREWRALTESGVFGGVYDPECDDPDGLDTADGTSPGTAPAEWFHGPKRGLLMPLVVGTVDHLLHAATRTKHVMLRHAGLAGKVVVLDEVHAYDVYTGEFLLEALRWLGDAGVPVIMLSATLPPALRDDLTCAYLDGAASTSVHVEDVGPVDAYPVLRSASWTGGRLHLDHRTSVPARPTGAVRVDVLDEGPDAPPEAVAALVRDALADGGCALVVRNTVRRAQDTYRALKTSLSDDAVLVHARLTIGDRTDRMERILDLLGPPDRENPPARPRRLVVVATQLAEQSFDADFDLLVTDLAPVDLLLQRMGRVHRHERPPGTRPAAVVAPRVVVTGMRRNADGAPSFPSGSLFVYGRHLLLRTAALIGEGSGDGGWRVPDDVPTLVRRCYDIEDEHMVPESWRAVADEAGQEAIHKRRRQKAKAQDFLLTGEFSANDVTLAGLHDRGTADLVDDDAVAAVVRDGPETVEVVLVRRDERGHRTLDGRDLGPNGDAVWDAAVAEEVTRSTVRLPPQFTAEAQSLLPLVGWRGHPWLGRSKALVLEQDGSTVLGHRRIFYDRELGLCDEPAP